jgi:hypothetical protein
MVRALVVVLLLAGCVEAQTGAGEVTVREVADDLVLRGAVASVGTDMVQAMAVTSGIPRAGVYERRDTIRVGGVTGRTEALAVVASYCRVTGRAEPVGLASAVVRLDQTTGEYVVPVTCGAAT